MSDRGHPHPDGHDQPYDPAYDEPAYAEDPAYDVHDDGHDDTAYYDGDPDTVTGESPLPTEHRAPGSRRGTRRRTPGVGCLVALVVLALLVAGLYVGVTRGIDAIESRLGGDAEDYPGPGSGRVAFEVATGDSASDIAAGLAEADVVASAEAFTDVAATDDRSMTIQVGTYELRREMSAEDALEVLVNPENLVAGETVTVPEGYTVEQIVDVLVESTGVPQRRWERALEQPDALGLPDYADGNPEGYLFPATYEVGEDPRPREVLGAMVDRWEQAAEEADLEGRAAELGYTPAELMVVASLVEAEARGEDMPRVSRVIYNRIENPGTAGTTGLLQIDAAVNYALGREPIARLTLDEIDSVADSPYNTYTQPGLPPTPIEAPGDDAIEAAANPAEGDWYYYVTVNLETGETKFAETPEEFSQFRAELDEYCDTQSDRC